MSGEMCGCCEGPWAYRDHHNNCTFHPHFPAIGPRTQSTRSLLHSPQRGVFRTLMFLPTDATRAKFSACRGPWWQRTTMTWSPWSDSRAWWVTRVGFLSIPVRPGILKTPKHFANHAQLLDQRICVMVVLRCHGSLQTETLAQVASVVEGLGVWWHPARVVPQLHANWILGPKVGSCRVKCVGVVKVPGRTGIITTTAHFTHISRPSAQGLSPQGVCCTLPSGVSSEPWCFCPLMQPGAKFWFARSHGTRERPQHGALGLTVGIDGELCGVFWANLVPRDAHDTCTFHRQFPTISPRMLCCRHLVARLPVGWDFGTGCFSGRRIRCLMTPR